MSNKTPLEQTKSTFRIRGVVAGLGNERAYKEGIVANGKYKGKKYRRLRFPVKTSPVNTIYVELYGMEQDQVTVYKEERERGAKSESKKIDFAKRHNVPAGYRIIETSFEIEKDDEGNIVQRGLIRYDAIAYIRKYLKDGDSVYASGSVEFSDYTNPKTQKTSSQTNYSLRSLNLTDKPVDFEDESFKELASFKQEIVFVGSDIADGRVYVTGRTIQYGDKFSDVQFVVADPSVGEDKESIESIQTTAEGFAETIKFGAFIEITGLLVNRVELVEEEQAEVKRGPFGNKRANGFSKRAIRNYITEFQIIGADNETYVEGKYTEDDFVPEEFIETSTENEADENPFGDDDLPF